MKFTVKDTSAALVEAMKFRGEAIQEASVIALNRTTVNVYNGLKDMLATKIDRPTKFTLNSLQFQKARADRLYGVVETRLGTNSVPSGRYLSPLINGGPRQMKSSEKRFGKYWTPARGADLDASGNIRGSTMNKVLSQLKLRADPAQNATISKRSKAKRKSEAYFVQNGIVFQRKGGAKPTPFIILVEKIPTYRKMLPWYETAQQIVDQSLAREYYQALDELLR